jgi:PST family polysaccharide transporter
VIGASQVYRVALTFITNILLARLLLPTDFGLVATVSTILALVAVIQDLGLYQATIQRQRMSPAQMSALFWIQLAFGVLLAAALALSAPAVAWFFGDSRLRALTIAFAFLTLLNASQTQQLALLNRDLRFKAVAVIDAAGVTAGAVIGTLVAWLTSSYWALFASALASSVVSLAGLWAACSFRPGRPSFEGDQKEILQFGSGVSGFNLINYFARNSDKLLIGRFFGNDQLGFYDRAYRLLLFPLQQIHAPLGRLMLPLLSRLQSDPFRYRKAYVECISLMMMASQPGLVFVTVFSTEVFLILLGPNWLAAAPIFRWLGLCALHQVVTATVGWLFLSQGRGGDFFKIGLFNGVTTVASFVLGLPWGALGVAISYTVGNYLVQLPATFWAAGRRGPVSTQDLVTISAPHAVATAASCLALLGASAAFPAPNGYACLGFAVLSYIVYGLAILAFPAKRSILTANLRSVASLLPAAGRA